MRREKRLQENNYFLVLKKKIPSLLAIVLAFLLATGCITGLGSCAYITQSTDEFTTTQAEQGAQQSQGGQGTQGTNSAASDVYQPTSSSTLSFSYDFDELAMELFKHEVTLDTLTFNQMISNPQDFGLQALEPKDATLGELTFDAYLADDNYYLALIDNLDALNGKNSLSADAIPLTEDQQLTERIIREVIAQTIEGEYYYYYDEPLLPDMGIQAQLPLSLIEYNYRSIKDIDVYIALLKDTPRYFEQVINFERQRAGRGLLMSKSCYEAALANIEEFLTPVEQNMIVLDFNEDLDSGVGVFASLNDEQKDDYRNQLLDAVRGPVYAAYDVLGKYVSSLKYEAATSITIYDYASGTDYYRSSMKSMGFAQSPEESAILLDKYLDIFVTVMMDNPSSFLDIPDLDISTLKQPISAKDGLEYLKTAMQENFPDIGSINYTVDVAPDGLTNATTLAYYRIPPVDDADDNRVFYYPQNLDSDFDLMTTLAHEGFPGHMYQTNYFSQKNPAPLRKLLGSVAYMEGYANYAENIAASYLGLSSNDRTVQMAYTDFLYALHARADIGVHYQGWDVRDLEQYLAPYGYEDAASYVYDTVLDLPMLYLPYGLGTLTFLDMREVAETELGLFFDEKEFHSVLLDAGPVSLTILNERVDAWREGKK
ncbi:MAG: DUF885 domain-containing protein [Coriobacteriales bacterium]|jgi:uncharacterized protein (DUF885 family)|nr:DUF885 domain-containing protein [Coriobacteriales bacterium]